MLLYICIALLLVGLLLGLQHKRWDKDHYWDDKANTWRRKDGGPVNYHADD
jgi:hypothetical protein